MKDQLLFKEQWPAVTGGRHRYGIALRCAHNIPAEAPEVPMVGNRTARSFRAAGANAGKAVVDAGAGGVLEAIPRVERSWLAIGF